MIQVSDEVTFLRADCACSVLVSRAQVQHSPHKGNCSLERSQHTHLFFFFLSARRERDKTSALKRLLARGGQETRFASTFSWCHILHLQSKEMEATGASTLQACHSNRSRCKPSSAARSHKLDRCS